MDQSLYKAGQSIRYDAEKMKQKIVTENYSGERKIAKMRDRVLGFPISDSNLALILWFLSLVYFYLYIATCQAIDYIST